jgi:hypothetical protein
LIADSTIARRSTDSEIQTSIDNGHPFIAGISPTMPANPFGPEHAVVVIGYDCGTDGRTLV